MIVIIMSREACDMTGMSHDGHVTRQASDRRGMSYDRHIT